MLGFLIGTVCLIALIHVLRSEHRRGHLGRGRAFGCGGHHLWHGWRFGKGIGQNPLLRRMFRNLDTTPGQEKDIRGAVEELSVKASAAKQSLFESRGQLAQLFRSEAFDEQALGAVIARHDEVVEQVRGSAVDALTKIYKTLDPHQRERVATWLESGLSRPRKKHPYRTAPQDA